MEDSNGKLPQLDVGIYGRPCFGERVSGDFAFADQKDGWLFMAIIDGLGHGKHAFEIAQKAKAYLTEHWDPNVLDTISKLHAELKHSGGAAVGLASLNLEDMTLNYVGIGNTVFRKHGDNFARLFSREGMIGERMRTPIEQQITLEQSDILVLYTDGVSENFDFANYPQITIHSSGLVAKNIVRKFSNQFDDATCLVLKFKDEN